ncbi:RNA polymerase sigma factor [Clostridium sp. 19966]|uniref:RNA polymerase sigma factor n=1 Tax=Clostridium sp. 19966 TaxID=2768166 RepID=UPI0028DEACB1|nr:RNA polymerase sigma factor [Clostridium sp. 19966]MDT8715721.1 RNA polymerase sigma factor [Clostridium sp. 19966]
MEEKKLIKRCQSGDKDAFQKLITRYHPYVYKFLMKICQDENIAEDLVQETFMKIIRSIEKFDVHGKSKFSTYIITVCRNCYIDYYRKNKKLLRNIPIDENLKIQCSNLEELIITKVTAENIEKELEKLPEEQKIAIRMKYIEGMTLKEIGKELELESKTIKSRIHHGIIKLRKVFEGDD